MVRLAGAVALCAMLAAPHYAAADADALWYIVNEQCVPDQQQFHSPKPCDQVDLAAGYVVLKDRVGDTQFLLMPTAHITGIESPEILAPGSPNYWNAAWQARHFVDERAHRTMPPETISLAVNSADARTQNQLHIHIDCLRLDVQAALREHAGDIGTAWGLFPAKLSGHDYMAMRIDRPDLATPIRSSCSPTASRVRAPTWRSTRWSWSATPAASCCSPATAPARSCRTTPAPPRTDLRRPSCS